MIIHFFIFIIFIKNFNVIIIIISLKVERGEACKKALNLILFDSFIDIFI